MQTSNWLIVYISGAVQGMFLCGALLAMKTGNRRATVILAALVAVFTVMLLAEAVELLVRSPTRLLIIGASINTELAIGPLLLLFARSVLDPERALNVRDGRHFLPWLAGLATWLLFTGALYAGTLALTESQFHNVIAAYVVFKATFLYCYMLATYRALTRGLVDKRRFVAGRQPVEMRWLRRWLVGLAGVAGCIYLAFFLGYLGLPVPDSDNVGSLILALMIYLVSLAVLLRPWILSVRPRQADLDRYADDMQRLRQRLEREQAYLDPELTAGQLAEALGITENRLSAMLNDGMQTSFYELLARYRLAAFERLARDPQHRGRSVMELAFAAGFNSKASFYRLFRRSHDITPSAYLKHVAP